MISRLELRNFRNFKEAEVTFSPGVNVICGKNGQGKTNLLEAIHVLGFTKSMRTNGDREMIKFGEDFFTVKAGGLEIRLSSNGKKTLLKDGAVYPGSKDWLGLLPVVFFGPQELGIVKNEPGLRRRFMDMAICQIRPRYTRALSEYNRAKDHKSKILKNHREKPGLLETLPEFNEKMIACGELLIRERTAFVEKLAELSEKYHRDISGGGETLKVSYTADTDLRGTLERVRDREIAAGTCLAGPHRDDIRSTVNGIDARAFASQGQAKTAALAFKLSERDILREYLGNPVILLDDVLSELDETRRGYILGNMSGGQSIITDCDSSRLRELNAGQTINVSGGCVFSNGERECI